MIKLRQIVSTIEQNDELFIIIGFQPDIDGKENVVALQDSNKKTFFEHKKNIIIHNDKTVNDLFGKKSDQELFCYRCISNTKPYYKVNVSEYYTDIDNSPVVTALPHCSECDEELYSKAFHTAAEDYKNYKKIESSYFSHEV